MKCNRAERRQSEMIEERVIMETKMVHGMRCPKCGSKNIEEFIDAYWFLCHECGYNSPAYVDEDEAKNAFLNGVIRRDINP